MIHTDQDSRSETQSLRRVNTMLCLWRLCGNAACRRARACRGRAHLCPKRNSGALPEGVREFFVAFLAAKYACIDFERFRADMDGREETRAFFAWREAGLQRESATHDDAQKPAPR